MLYLLRLFVYRYDMQTGSVESEQFQADGTPSAQVELPAVFAVIVAIMVIVKTF